MDTRRVIRWDTVRHNGEALLHVGTLDDGTVFVALDLPEEPEVRPEAEEPEEDKPYGEMELDREQWYRRRQPESSPLAKGGMIRRADLGGEPVVYAESGRPPRSSFRPRPEVQNDGDPEVGDLR